MPRLPRIRLDGVLYAITVRGVSPEPIFKDAADYDAYLNLLADYQQRYGFLLFAYCLLPDHVHLALEPKAGTTVSAIMHDLSASYTRYFNKRHGRSGHLFQARFRDTVTEKSPYLALVTAYLHRHPVSSGLVRDAREYLYSSYGLYLDRQFGPAGRMAMEPAIREVMALLSSMGTKADYEAYVRSVSDADIDQLRQALQQKILGSEAFIQAVDQRIYDAQSSQRHSARAAEPGFQDAPRPRAPVVLGGCLAGLSLVVGLAIVVLIGRVGMLEQTVAALSQENEASFRAHVAAARQGAQLAGLDGTQWEVHVVPMAGDQTSAVQVDFLQFGRNQVMSKASAADGFAHSNYTLTPQPNGHLLWETMQTNQRGEVVCWHGESQGVRMRGVVTRQPAGKALETFNFVGVAKPLTDSNRSQI